MKFSTIIAMLILAVMIAIYFVESEEKQSATLVIIVLMAIGILVEKLLCRRAE